MSNTVLVMQGWDRETDIDTLSVLSPSNAMPTHGEKEEKSILSSSLFIALKVNRLTLAYAVQVEYHKEGASGHARSYKST